MGLIDLRTDLKSLRYGNDQRGGGSSNQPYITTSIPEGYAPTSTDFLLRNGYLNPVSSFQDVKRLSKFFTDTKTPNGVLFTIKQELLERQNPKLVNVNRIYNPLGTLSQAGLNSLGFHFNKQGLNNVEPSYFSGGTYGYYYATRGFGVDPTFQFLQGEGYENRLTIAYTAKIEKKPLGSLSINPFGVSILAGEGILLSYPGGPNAPLGLGTTNIRIQNPTRTVDLPSERTTFGLRFGGDNIANKNYLKYTGSPNINWIYNWRLGGVSDLASKDYIELTSLSASTLLNRNNIYINKPEKRTANKFNLNSDKLGNNPEYLKPTGVKSANVNWVYTVVDGVSQKYYDLPIIQRSYPSNAVVPFLNGASDAALLNRNTTVNKPSFSVNQHKNSFNLNSDQLKTSNSYLRPTNVSSSNVNWVYVSGSTVNTNYTPVEHPSETVLKQLNTFKTGKYKGSNGLISPSKLTEATDKYSSDTGNKVQTTLNNNLLQNIPIIQTFDDSTKTINQTGTTVLSFLTPHYNIQKDGKDIEAPYPNIKTFNREDTYGTAETVYKKSYTKLSNKSYATDDIQEQYVLQRTDSNDEIEKLKDKDLIRFFFEINNNDAVTNTENFWLFFRAYLNEFGDDYKAEWDSYKYVGRAENFYKYTGFSRTISLSFTVYAHSRAEMKPIYQKLNYLAGITAPNYSEAGYMRGNFVNITVGNYLNSVPCIIESVGLKPSFEAGWDINRDDNGIIITPTTLNSVDDVGQLPRMIDVSLSIIPIHSFTPRFQASFINTPTDDPQVTI
jgi:hypothetical protein